MASPKTCLNCGAPLTGEARQGFCPKCLFLQASAGTVRANLPDEEEIGTVIERYKLLEKVGEGGFGAVYVAEQREPVKRRVALKIIKLGMDTRQVIARFEAERQALALMDHPNIAKVLDGGATETGRPYFVMDLVRGRRITDYCDQNNLSTEQRLDLFTQVCHAIQHAHQKGIIHRDIKPSNILVTLVDGRAVPKVIDFGIAKATQGQLTDQTVYTQLHQFIGTPAYMSPEQAQLSGVDVDTRSDIYSLGVLLYELLTGHTPFDPKTLLSAGLDEMRRIIRETDPPRPSTRISTLDQVERTTVAKHRQAEPGALSRLVRGDLDWIVMKCLEKERGRRYETANNIALDVEHHLRQEPVSAAAPSTVYRAGKFVRRHKVGLAMAVGMVLLLAAGVVASTWQAVRATRAERAQSRLRSQAEASQKRSQTEAAKATAISDFLQQILGSANPDAAKGTDYTVRQLLDDFSLGLGAQLKDQPEVEAAIRATIGNAYRRLGATEKAQPHLETALALRRRIFGDQHPKVAESLLDLAFNQFEQRRRAEAEALTREALAIFRAQGLKRESVRALAYLQLWMMAQGRFPEAKQVGQEGLDLARDTPGARVPETADILHRLSWAERQLGDPVEAERLAREAVALHRQLHGNNHPETAYALRELAYALDAQRKYADAALGYAEAKAILQKEYGSTHPHVVELRALLVAALQKDGNLAEVLHVCREAASQGDAAAQYRLGRGYAEGQGVAKDAAEAIKWLGKAAVQGNADAIRDLKTLLASQGKLAEMEIIFRDEVAARKQRLGAEHPDVAISLIRLADRLRDQGKLAEAEGLFREALVMQRKLLGDEHLDVATSAGMLAGFLWSNSRLAEAEPLYREALTIQRKHLPNKDVYVATTVCYLAGVLRWQGKLDEAETVLREELVRLRAPSTNGPTGELPQLGFVLHDLANVLRERKALAEARSLAEESLALYRRHPDWAKTERGHAFEVLGKVLSDLGDPVALERLYREDLAELRARLPADDPVLAGALHNWGDTLRNASNWIQAEDAFRQAAAMRRKLFGDQRLETVNSLRGLVGVLDHNGKLAEAVSVYRALADSGDAGAQNTLGLMYWEGRGVSVDPAEAVKWFRQAANQGDDGGRCHLGEAYAVGRGVPQDSAEAIRCYREVVEAKSAHPGWVHNALYALSGLLSRASASNALSRLFPVPDQLTELESLFRARLPPTGASTNASGLAVAACQCLAQFPALYLELGEELSSAGNPAAAHVCREKAALFGVDLTQAPQTAPAIALALNNAAWSLATTCNVDSWQSAVALPMAEKAAAATSRTNPLYLDTLAAAYAASGQFTNAVRVQQEAIALLTNDEQRRDYGSRLSLFQRNLRYRDHGWLAERAKDLVAAGKFAEAEPLARECLALREQQMPDDWSTFNSRSMLGGCLLGQKKYAEAEPLLLAGYRGMKELQDKMPEAALPRLPEALDRIADLYTALGRPEEVSKFLAVQAAKEQSARRQAAEKVNQARLHDALVLYLTFDQEWTDGKVTDMSGKGNHGRVFGARWESGGWRGGAVRFTPPNQFIVVSNSASLNPPQLTVAAWVKTSRQDDVWRRVVDKNYATGFALSIGGMVGSNSRFKGRADMEIAMELNKQQSITTSAGVVTDGKWHHLAATYDGADQFLYVDGMRQSQGVRWKGKVPANSHDLTIGINLINPEPSEVGASFDGLIDDLMLFNRALSPEEIAALSAPPQ